MNNLKRVLSLGLAGTMLAGMMMVGASAAGVENFTDASEIDHAQAVSTMVALNIINGNDDGSFAPDRVVTRAEMAKMITIARNGGRDPVLGVKATPTYTDIKGHWAEKYIEYCSSLNIISGRGDGTFQPDATVTGTEAAKMTLTAMGYDATVFKFTGVDWAINVNTEANNAKMYDKLDGVNPDEGISRDNVAQLLYNGVLAPGKKMSPSLEITNGNVTYQYTDGPSLFVDKYEGYDETTTLTAYSYDESKGEWTYTLPGTDHGFVTTTEDYTGLYGMKVRVLYKVDDDDSTKTVVYGMFLKDSKVVLEGYSGDFTASNQPAATDTSIKINDVTYKLDGASNTIPVKYTQTGVTTGKTVRDVKDLTIHYSYKMVDTDGNGKVDVVYITPFTVGKVTYVGKDSITVALQNSDVDSLVSGSRKLEDIDVYEDVSKDDYVMCVNENYAPKEMPTYTKLEPVSGTVTGTRTSSEYKMDGKWFTKVTSTTLNANDTIDYIALGSVIYYAKVTSGSTGTDALALVYNIAKKDVGGISSDYFEAGIIMADGTKKTAKVVEINDYEIQSSDISTGVTATVTGVDASERVPSSFQIGALMGSMVKYETNSDGELSFWTIPAGYNPGTGNKIIGFDGTLAAAQTFSNTSDTVGGKELADDAVVFVWNSVKKNAKVYSGKELKNTVASTFGVSNGTFASGVYGKSNGFSYAQAVVLQNTAYPTINTGSNYGYLVADAYTSKESGTNYRYFEFWDGEKVVTAKEKDETGITAFKSGVVITYDITDATEDDNSNITVKNVSAPTMGLGTVDGWDGVKKLQISGSSKSEVDSDTVILYVNSKDQKGVDGGEISEAVDQDGDRIKEPNVMYLEGGDKNFALVVVDVDQEMHANAAQVQKVLADETSDAVIEAALATNNVKVTASSAYTVANEISIPSNRTLEIVGGANNVTLTGGVALADATSKLIITNTSGTITITPALAAAGNVTLKSTGAITASAGITVTNGAAVVIDGDLTASGQTIAVTNGTLTAGDITATTVSIAAGSITAGDITGALSMTGGDATVKSATSYANTGSGTLTITGDTSAAVTLPAGKVVMTGTVGHALTVGATTELTLTKVFDATTVFTSTNVTAGAKLTMKVAPSAVSAANSYGAFFATADAAAALTADQVAVDTVYVFTAASGITNSTADGWVAQA